MVLIKACLMEDVPLNEMREASILGRVLLLANVDGQFYAMDGTCSHQFANLSLGSRDGFIVTCPLHGAQFDIRTGKVVKRAGPGERTNDLRAYRVVIADGCLNIDM
jgi:3-phenylpropionate/trans-cinnamate dioxygenase ferredoxin subunit